GGGGVGVERGEGAAGLAGGKSHFAGNAPASIAVGDLNGDGSPDLVVPDAQGHRVNVLLNSGHGSFGRDARLEIEHESTSLAVGDIDGDGRLDAATVSYDDATLTTV